MAKMPALPKPAVQPDVAQELGQFVATFNHVDWLLAGFLSEIANSPQFPLDLLLGKMMFRAILDATEDMVRRQFFGTHPDYMNRALGTLKRLGKLSEKRNDLAHGSWSELPLLGYYALMKRKRDGTGKFLPMNAETIREAREELERVADELVALTSEYDTIKPA